MQNKLKLQTLSLAKLEMSLEEIAMKGSSMKNLIAREKSKGVPSLAHQSCCPLINQLTTLTAEFGLNKLIVKIQVKAEMLAFFSFVRSVCCLEHAVTRPAIGRDKLKV